MIFIVIDQTSQLEWFQLRAKVESNFFIIKTIFINIQKNIVNCWNMLFIFEVSFCIFFSMVLFRIISISRVNKVNHLWSFDTTVHSKNFVLLITKWCLTEFNWNQISCLEKAMRILSGQLWYKTWNRIKKTWQEVLTFSTVRFVYHWCKKKLNMMKKYIQALYPGEHVADWFGPY